MTARMGRPSNLCYVQRLPGDRSSTSSYCAVRIGRAARGLGGAGAWVAACGFSGHGFMQSPAVGRALAEEILLGGSELDLSPYRLERFAEGAVFPEHVVL